MNLFKKKKSRIEGINAPISPRNEYSASFDCYFGNPTICFLIPTIGIFTDKWTVPTTPIVLSKRNCSFTFTWLFFSFTFECHFVKRK